MTQPPIRLVLVDDHTMLREGLRRSMEAAGLSVVGEASDGEEGIRLVADVRPDVVLMDVSMPVLDGIEAARRIHADHPEIAVVMLTMHSDADVITRAVKAGAVGYVVKDASVGEVVAAVRLAANRDTVMSQELAGSMLDEVRSGGNPDAEEAEATENLVSRREEEVLQLVAQGLSTPEVAATLFISVKTVKNHLASIYAKLDSHDRTQAVLRAVKMGIVRLD